MFMPLLDRLRELFPETQIDIGLQAGVGQDVLFPHSVPITDPNARQDDYECTFLIHFPMSEHLQGAKTKAEWCCEEELGIEPFDSLPDLPKWRSPLVACHFQATALPDPCNPTPEVVEAIWKEIEEVGLIPIESFFKHGYFNPVNEKHPVIDRDIRNVKPSIPKLVGLLRNCFASICVASGNLPVSLAVMPRRTLYLAKAYPISCYTREDIEWVDVNNYEPGFVRRWLVKLGRSK
jgi:hypothetical protein